MSGRITVKALRPCRLGGRYREAGEIFELPDGDYPPDLLERQGQTGGPRPPAAPAAKPDPDPRPDPDPEPRPDPRAKPGRPPGRPPVKRSTGPKAPAAAKAAPPLTPAASATTPGKPGGSA